MNTETRMNRLTPAVCAASTAFFRPCAIDSRCHVGTCAMGTRTENDGVVTGETFGKSIRAVENQVAGDRVAACAEDDGVLPSCPIHASDPVAVGGKQSGQSTADSTRGADLKHLAGVR